jgi:hypothetical protein
VSLDVFKEAHGWLHSANSICNEGPQMPWVGCSEPLSGCAERLARVAARQYAHLSVKAVPWEGFKIRPDRSCVQESRFHLCNQVRAGEGFDLAKSDCSQIWEHSLESKVNAAISGT